VEINGTVHGGFEAVVNAFATNFQEPGRWVRRCASTEMRGRWWICGRAGGQGDGAAVGGAYHVIRAVATGDGSIGQLLGYHYLWNWAARPVGTPEQIAFVEAQAARNRWFFGGAGQPVRRGRADSR
jgi:hypothetical protein